MRVIFYVPNTNVSAASEVEYLDIPVPGIGKDVVFDVSRSKAPRFKVCRVVWFLGDQVDDDVKHNHVKVMLQPAGLATRLPLRLREEAIQ